MIESNAGNIDSIVNGVTYHIYRLKVWVLGRNGIGDAGKGIRYYPVQRNFSMLDFRLNNTNYTLHVII